MRRVRTAIVGALLVTAVTGATLAAQRTDSSPRWLALSDSLPANTVTLIVLEAGTRRPVAHPLVCVEPGGEWMVGMADGRLRFGGNIAPDTVHLRILGPSHQTKALSLVWAQSTGRAVQVALDRRPGPPVDPACDGP